MSTDESGDEKGVYIVRVKDWRSAQLLAILEYADANRNRLNGYGNNMSGGQPRRRVRPRYAPTSVRRAMMGLPINFYNPLWYSGLTERQQEDLDAQPPMEFPEISD